MPSFTGQVLNVSSSDLFDSILAQIDPGMLIVGTGSPVGVLAAVKPIFYCDTAGSQLYFCYVADGTIPGTNWIAVNFTVVDATTSVPGIARIATLAEVQAGSVTDKIVAPDTLATVYAKSGANGDITQITGLLIPLAEGQGGTGHTTLLAGIKNSLPSMVPGAFLSNDGTDYLWQFPGSYTVRLVSSNSTLVVNAFHVITANSLNLTLPSCPVGSRLGIGFLPSITSGPNIGTSGDSIEGAAGPLVCDVLAVSFELCYSGNTYGWFVTAST